ncbi:PQQ-binding-like beta-propeller repeat protein [Haloterrigena sp. SYSU A558-1]|uniref:PQQ-binding-like beta-propeller repeat protein n=1 Tax=Haloterrigena gelatinilytica TaxID=2741724 RepID=A0ABX2LK50_9EURY|nr:PQQ-binding-like beta-propeller repeat protein [Haloterrigena gelatinilytica]NUC74955.1 PQQ-binding-like beta-propeller repeat protein [Haloterrigena gelatinilytica]
MTDKTRSPSDSFSSQIHFNGRQCLSIFIATLLVVSMPIAFTGGLGGGGVARADTGGPSSTIQPSLTAVSDNESIGGDVIYTASTDNDVKAIDKDTGEVLWNYTGHSNTVGGISVGSDENLIFTASEDQTLRAIYANNGTEKWTFTGYSVQLAGVAVSSDGETVYSAGADATVRAHNSSTGDQLWNYTGHSDTVRYLSVSQNGGSLFTASHDNTVRSLDTGDGSENWVYSGHTDTVRAVVTSPDDETVYSAADDGSVRALSADGGSELWTNTASSNAVRAIGVDYAGKKIYVGGANQKIRALSTSDGSEVWEVDIPNDIAAGGISEYVTGNILIGDSSGTLYKYAASDGTQLESFDVHSNYVRAELPAFWTGLGTVSGVVTTQDGVAVDSATVTATGITEPALDPSDAKSLEEQANDLRDELTNPLPDSWDPNYDLESHYKDANANYLLVHEAKDWGLGTTTSVDSNVDAPRLQLDSDQQVVLSMWDPTKNGDWIGNQVDNSFPGKAVSGTIVIEQKGPTGETIDSMERETTTIATTTGGRITGENKHPGVRAHLSQGVYVAYPEGARERGYTFVVGSPDELANSWESDLKTEAGKLTDRAKRIRSLVNSNELVQATAKTNETGHFTLQLPSNTVSAEVNAMKVDGTTLDAINDPSMQDLREAQSGGYNGTFYLPAPTPTSTNPPTENLSVTVYRSPEVPLSPMEDFADLQQWLRNQQLNETISGLQSEYDKRFEEMNRSVLERTYNSHRSLVETVPGTKDRYLERSDLDSVHDAGDLSDSQLATETNHMQVALSKAGQIEPPDPGEDPITIKDGELHVEYPLPGGVDTDTLQPEIHWSDGEVGQIPEEYWSVESTGAFGLSNELVIDGYPIDSSDPAAFDLRVLGGGSGGFLDDRLSALNPSFSGSIPDVRAVDLNTMAPGDSERVSMTVRPGDDSNYGGLESVEVLGPDGQQLTTDVTGDKASFETNGAGKHFVRATVTDSTGGQFVHTFQLRALEQGRNDPATVRAETATGNRVFALVGEKLDDAEIRVDGGSLEVDAIAPGGEIPSSIHIKPRAAMEQSATSIDVRVLEGRNEATVDTTVETVIHLDSLADGAVVWRGEPSIWGQPLADGGTRYGEVMERDIGDGETKYVIRTYSNSDGSVSLTIDENPGFVATNQHRIAQYIPRPSLPVLSIVSSLVGSLSVVGVGLFARRRQPKLR